MSVAAVLWGNLPVKLERSQLNIPLIVYLSNVAFAGGLSLASGFWIPVSFSLLFGVAPVLVLWWMAKTSQSNTVVEATTVAELPVEVALK